MKVLHVISSIDPRHGGVTEGLRQLAEASMEFGCSVEAVTLDQPGRAFLNQFSFPVHALGPASLTSTTTRDCATGCSLTSSLTTWWWFTLFGNTTRSPFAKPL